MELKPKALYNLLRMNAAPGVEAWKTADYRQIPTEELFERVGLDKERFFEVAERCSSPEELTSFFLPEELEPEKEDQIYLVFFELWRRLLPEEQSLSIFCDELDHCIVKDDEGLQDLLFRLQELVDSKEAFAEISTYFANDLESFLYDYIAEQIDSGQEDYAQELVEAFTGYIERQIYFQLLQVRLSGEGLETLLEEELDLELYFEILDYLTLSGDRDLFLEVAKETLSQITNEEELLELLELSLEYYRSLDLDEKEVAIDCLINSKKNLLGTISSLQEILSH